MLNNQKSLQLKSRPANKLPGWASTPAHDLDLLSSLKVRDQIFELLVDGRLVLLPEGGLHVDEVLQELCVEGK